MKGDIEFRDVSFSYSSRRDVPVLQDFNLTVPANTTAALVGASGSGKSTVVALLQRFYDVNSGTISIDGNDIRSLDLQWLRKHIGYVQQEPQLFGMSVRENVRYGVDRDVPDEEVIVACKVSNVSVVSMLLERSSGAQNADCICFSCFYRRQMPMILS
jgi:ABC-type multidrug transport system fused ATPase/permease subunit